MFTKFDQKPQSKAVSPLRALLAKKLMTALSLVMVVVISLASSGFSTPPGSTIPRTRTAGQIEPDAGSWKTWVLSSGDQLRLPAPPSRSDTQREIAALLKMTSERDAADLERIAYWNAGSPVYRWNRLAVDAAVDKNLNTLIANRHLALLNTALEDAMIAAWDSKYAYNRPRPSKVNRNVVPVIPMPNSPSYPSEHAVAAGTASRILAAIFPEKAAEYAALEQDAALAFMKTGTQYPSDVIAGIELGHQVADLALAHAASDRSTDPWTGTVPTEPGKWTGTNPGLPQAANWRTYILASGDEVRPGPPPAYDSAELAAEMDQLRALERDPRMTMHAYFWEFGAGGNRNFWFFNEQLARMNLEYNLNDNAPRAARAYALLNVALLDSGVACWDAKYTYWAMRPFQLDPNFKPLFTTPNHPSYPSAHSCLSFAAADVLAYLYPTHAAEFSSFASEAGQARVWAGIHFSSDVTAGEGIGHAVAGKVIQYAEMDGSKQP